MSEPLSLAATLQAADLERLQQHAVKSAAVPGQPTSFLEFPSYSEADLAPVAVYFPAAGETPKPQLAKIIQLEQSLGPLCWRVGLSINSVIFSYSHFSLQSPCCNAFLSLTPVPDFLSCYECAQQYLFPGVSRVGVSDSLGFGDPGRRLLDWLQELFELQMGPLSAFLMAQMAVRELLVRVEALRTEWEKNSAGVIV